MAGAHFTHVGWWANVSCQVPLWTYLGLLIKALNTFGCKCLLWMDFYHAGLFEDGNDEFPDDWRISRIFLVMAVTN